VCAQNPDAAPTSSSGTTEYVGKEFHHQLELALEQMDMAKPEEHNTDITQFISRNMFISPSEIFHYKTLTYHAMIHKKLGWYAACICGSEF
jgi:hypothetical protein